LKKKKEEQKQLAEDELYRDLDKLEAVNTKIEES